MNIGDLGSTKWRIVTKQPEFPLQTSPNYRGEPLSNHQRIQLYVSMYVRAYVRTYARTYVCKYYYI